MLITYGGNVLKWCKYLPLRLVPPNYVKSNDYHLALLQGGNRCYHSWRILAYYRAHMVVVAVRGPVRYKQKVE
uniref:Uncharacterized protein n=1 Tax=Megaselia scalaris TaxID=36166 RepID=T1H175_MEGSC